MGSPTEAGTRLPLPEPREGRGEGRASSFVVLSTVARFDECSGAGGEHYVFRVDDPSGGARDPVLVHAGGHAVYLDLLPQGGWPATRWLAAEVAMVQRVSEDGDDNPDSSVSGWCLDDLPRTQGEVLRWVDAADRADARRIVEQLRATGLPRSQLVVRAARGAESFAVVRILARVEGSEDRFTVQSVEGAAPAEIDLAVGVPDAPRRRGTGPFTPWTGDWLVVAVARDGARSVVTRALLADDEGAARRWRAAIVARGWPPMASGAGWAGDAAFTRWAARGRVVRGADACGPEMDLDTWEGSHFQIDPPRVAAPAGVALGDRVTAVVVPQPRDRCGRVARVVRAWVTPSEQRPSWVVAAQREPRAPTLP